METERASKLLDFYSKLPWLIAHEDFIFISHHHKLQNSHTVHIQTLRYQILHQSSLIMLRHPTSGHPCYTILTFHSQHPCLFCKIISQIMQFPDFSACQICSFSNKAWSKPAWTRVLDAHQSVMACFKETYTATPYWNNHCAISSVSPPYCY
jgi:hypothetical protein